MLSYLEKIITKNKKLTFSTHDLEDLLIATMGKDKYYRSGGYVTFANSLGELHKNSFISYVCPKKHNNLNPQLPLKIKKVIVNNTHEHITHLQDLCKTIHPKISLAYYQQHQSELEFDLKKIYKINNFFMKDKDFHSFEVSVNERSFQIFNHEKFLSSSEGKSFLKKIGLNYSDLNCYETFEPFFSFMLPNTVLKENSNALIVENKDTFYSLKKIFLKNKNFHDNIEFSLLIYGEGKKIERSLSYIKEITQFNISFYYFGDIDSEGLSIFYRMYHAYQNFKIHLLTSLYRNIIENYSNTARQMHSKQISVEDHISFFCKYFLPDEQVLLKNMLKKNLCIPQEVLRKDILENLFCEH